MNDDLAALSTPALILSQTAFFQQLSPAQLQRVATLSELQRLPAGEPAYRVGEQARFAYVLVSGTVRLAVGLGARNASAGALLHRGDLFGWAALTPTCRLRIATASCVSHCEFLAIDGAGLLLLMEADHTLGYRLTTQLNRLITGTLTAFAGG